MRGHRIEQVHRLPAVPAVVLVDLGVGDADLAQLAGLWHGGERGLEAHLDALDVAAVHVTAPDAIPQRVIDRAFFRGQFGVDVEKFVEEAVADCLALWIRVFEDADRMHRHAPDHPGGILGVILRQRERERRGGWSRQRQGSQGQRPHLQKIAT